MAKQTINKGTVANDGTGDQLRTAFGKVNDNFTEIYDGLIAEITVKVTSSNYTVGATDSKELYGGIIYVTSAATITIPAVAVGASFSVVTIGDIAVSVDPNASDLIYLDGVALSDGDKVTNTSTAGDVAVFTYFDATGWYCASNGWTDGG